jgi:hypothetical protein
LLIVFCRVIKIGALMKKYLLLIEDENVWENFKKTINKDINSEIMELIKEKVKK